MSTNKIDISTVYEMFEKLIENKEKQVANKQSEEKVEIDLTAINAVTERLEDVIVEVRKPVKIEHHHKIEITSNWVLLLLLTMGIIILGLSYFICNQRQTIIQFKDNDLK